VRRDNGAGRTASPGGYDPTHVGAERISTIPRGSLHAQGSIHNAAGLISIVSVTREPSSGPQVSLAYQATYQRKTSLKGVETTMVLEPGG